MLAVTALTLMGVISLAAGLYLAATSDDTLTKRQTEPRPIPDRRPR